MGTTSGGAAAPRWHADSGGHGGHPPACLAALGEAGCGSPTVLPLWPRSFRPAGLVLVQGVKGGRGACRLLPGIVLHAEGSGFTPEAEAVLRDGAALTV